ncbi:MAG: bacteriocin ABC transporter ATP-binding protein [Pseudonocardiales bacterium]|nr:MAG: bacteriocin ABC transporter ATP-binding protein [Pseudonocardiales bacterium]
MCAVEARELVKVYKKNPQPAVNGIDFAVRTGEVFGLIGPNGAGKTTTIGMLTTRVRPTSGRVVVGGVDVVRDPAAARASFAVVPQRNNLDRSLSVRQNLLFHAAYHGVGRAERNRRADEVLERMGLAVNADDRIDHVSGGQSQRVMIARALMHAPGVLFLDEPSSGLDPAARRFVHERIIELRADGTTVVLTTHQIDEAERLCDRIAVLDHGRLLAVDTPDRLVRTLPGTTTVTMSLRLGHATVDAVVAALSALDIVERLEPVGNGRIRLYTDHELGAVVPAALKVLEDVGAELADLAVGRPSLEDVFIHLTGRELR